MPLSDGYGVLIGTVHDYFRDPPDDYGRYYHGNLIVEAPAGRYRCAIDVDSKFSAVGVEWRTVSLPASKLENLLALGTGYHMLASTPTSGAIDYIRSSMFTEWFGCLSVLLRLLGKEFRIADIWNRGESIDALQDLEPLVSAAQEQGLLVLVFGEPFTQGLGLHNIHQNQGDPPNTPWWDENSIWQDGCTILQQSEDRFVAFLNKFTTQSYWTDEDGHPR